jgi:nitrate reductase gamma subunit
MARASVVYDANLLDMPQSAMGVAVISVLFDVVLAAVGLALLLATRLIVRRVRA